MENLSRNLAQGSEIKNPDSSCKATECCTLLLVGHFGKIVSFRLTKLLLVALTTGVVVILGFAIFAVVSYHAIRVENAVLRETLEVLRTDPEAANRAKQAEKKTEPASGEEAIIWESEAAKPIFAASSALRSEARGTGRKKVDYPAHREESPAASASRSRETAPFLSPDRMSVGNFKMRRDVVGNALDFGFHLKNVDPEGRRLSGYTFAVLEPANDSRDLFRVCPRVALEDGRPSLFQKGESFSVARFKLVRGAFPNVGAIDRYGTVTIYVYSKTGELFVEEVFEVSKVLQP